MKKRTPLVLILAITLFCCCQPKNFPADNDHEFDNGSEITFPEIDEQLIDNLELLGKLWGFLKYHHPEVGKGNWHWDYELFRMLPNYLEVKNSAERDEYLLHWINKYGEIESCKRCKEIPSDAFIKPDLAWVENPDISHALQLKIKEIYTNRHQGRHYYIKMARRVGNPEFLHENSYEKMTFPDAGFRLLALYRYWNMIHYFFPYKYQTDKNWNEVLKEYIPMFISAKNGLEYELAALQIVIDVNDSHANLWGGNSEIWKARGDYFAPFRVQFVENKLVVVDYYNPELKEISGPEIGDVITHIDGKEVELIVEEEEKYFPGSNKVTKLRNISVHLLRSIDNTLKINYVSSGEVKEKEILLYNTDDLDFYYLYKVDENAKCYQLLDGNIGYITLANIKKEDISVIKKEFKDTQGIIIDIRNYPGTFVPFSLGSYFVSKRTPFVKFTEGSVNNPGLFTFTSPLKIPKFMKTYPGKLVVIVNEITQSQGEYTAMAFRAGDNTTIVGSTTAGADGNVSRITLPGGLKTMISGIGVFYPDGTETQRIGIIPDILIEPTIEGIRQGRDEVLERAIQEI